jgi:ABC-type multidrug transport system ATPase subunit
VRCIRNFVHLQDATVLVSLLQPAPEAFKQFDDVILLSEGSLVYHGPRGRILEFFETLGFRCPERKGIADFLQEVTSLKDQQVGGEVTSLMGSAGSKCRADPEDGFVESSFVRANACLNIPLSHAPLNYLGALDVVPVLVQ